MKPQGLIKVTAYYYRKYIRNFVLFINKFGLSKGFIAFYKIYRTKSGVLSISIPQCKTPIFLRAQTSDISVFEEVFLNECYEISFEINPKIIVDGEANIGCATLYFANKYPEARIIAVEPEKSNLAILKKNTYSYPNINIIRFGIWNKRAFLKIVNTEAENWSFRVQECSTQEGSIEAITIDEIIRISKAEVIDVLKLDIEGAEKEVLSGKPEWLGKINVLIIELHEHYSPGATDTFYKAISRYDFVESRKMGHIFLQKNSA